MQGTVRLRNFKRCERKSECWKHWASGRRWGLD